MRSSVLRRLVNFWPPLWYNAIRATRISPDFRDIEVKLHLRFYNRNYVGTHFGGNLFAMTDPWYMIMLMQNLGREYYVWDKKASIDFVSPGRGTVTAQFHLSQEKIDEILAATAQDDKCLPEFMVEIKDADQKLVARVHKVLYVKRKPPKSAV